MFCVILVKTFWCVPLKYGKNVWMTQNYELFPDQEPVYGLLDTLRDAQKGREQTFTTSQLIGRLGLEGDECDFRTLADRFTDDKSSVSLDNAVYRLYTGCRRLIHTTNKYAANPAQERLAGSLGTVISRQIEREKDICDVASDLVMRSKRPDLIPVETILKRERLQMVAQALLTLGEEALDDPDLDKRFDAIMAELESPDHYSCQNTTKRLFCGR